MASIESIEGARVYVRTAYGEPAVQALKQLGAHWDRERRLWWVGKAKLAQVQECLVGADRAQDESAARGEDSATYPRESPDDIRLTGKGEYKGRSYYIGSTTKDGTRCRLLTLPDAEGHYLDFWADINQVTIVKRYQSREVWDGRRYSNRTRTQYTTLGSIARFVAQQKDPATRRGRCTECDAYGPCGEPCSECGGEGSYV